MAEQMTWVRNDRYNQARKEERAAARRRYFADLEVQAAKDRLRQVAEEAAQAETKDAQRLNARVQAEVDRLLEGVNEVSAEMRDAMHRHVAQTQQEMDALRRSIGAVEEDAAELDRKIDALADQVSARFRALAEDAAGEASRAQLFSNHFHELLRRIHALTPSKLTPGVVEQELDPVSNFLTTDMACGDHQAAIGLAQSKIPEAVALLARLERLNAQFHDLREEARQLISRLGQQIQQLGNPDDNRQLMEIGSNHYDYDGRIVFWTNGMFAVAENNYADIDRRYSMAEADMDLSAMEAAIHQLNRIGFQLAECEDLALHEFLIFGMVQNLACAICDALTMDASWTLLSSGFAGDDARRSYQMAYTDGNGNTASFVIIPNREVSPQGSPGQIQFMVDVCDGVNLRNRENCAVIRNGLLERLRRCGIEIGIHNKNPRYTSNPDPASFVDDAVRQGDKTKEDRLAIVREQLQITTETGVNTYGL